MVNYYYGRVYVLWVDYSLNAIRLSFSDDCGQTWSSPETGPTGNMVSNLLLKGNIRANSLPMVRFNHVANKICLVWHERENANFGNNTDVYYTAKSSYGWQTKVKLNDNVSSPDFPTDQFMPALDYDMSGNLVVTFYDRRNDLNNLKYDLYMARIDSNGNRLDVNQRISTFQSDSSFSPSPWGYGSFIGDYHDVWSQLYLGTEYYLPAWIGIPPSNNVVDTYFSLIQP